MMDDICGTLLVRVVSCSGRNRGLPTLPAEFSYSCDWWRPPDLFHGGQRTISMVPDSLVAVWRHGRPEFY